MLLIQILESKGNYLNVSDLFVTVLVGIVEVYFQLFNNLYSFVNNNNNRRNCCCSIGIGIGNENNMFSLNNGEIGYGNFTYF